MLLVSSLTLCLLFMYAPLILHSHMPIALTLGISIKVTPPTCNVAILNLNEYKSPPYLRALPPHPHLKADPKGRTLPSFITLLLCMKARFRIHLTLNV